ncbi:hypothetical protein AB1A79_06030 [Bdellovibrio bacteriovorus]|uniref:Uncharacterized protein n=2 Tax=Bdellovibrio bacteriovorus TaxID=959 RepID=Q6MNC9_BDEBA|nr:hypothetical protein [Bdellovibrio bacteriovorus]CAE79223.1 hypothetical protein predicted by Glimmer/Critica [Bdellovibrio bacteriovorus HD100]
MRFAAGMLLGISILGSTVHATVDGNDRVALVVQHIQSDGTESDAFFVERAPIIGCYGLPQGPALQQWTAEYKVPSNIGCGGEKIDENINALTCAKVISAKEASDYMSFSEVTLDISKCTAKNNPNFISTIRTSAKINFPQSNKKKEVKLILISDSPKPQPKPAP